MKHIRHPRRVILKDQLLGSLVFPAACNQPDMYRLGPALLLSVKIQFFHRNQPVVCLGRPSTICCWPTVAFYYSPPSQGMSNCALFLSGHVPLKALTLHSPHRSHACHQPLGCSLREDGWQSAAPERGETWWFAFRVVEGGLFEISRHDMKAFCFLIWVCNACIVNVDAHSFFSPPPFFLFWRFW